MLGAALALASSLIGGASDFLGGTNSRRIGAMQWLFTIQLIGLAIACGWLALSWESPPDAATLLIATAAGLSVTVCLAAFFQAMVVGTISIVAPITATGVVIPIAAGIVGGERPSAVQVVGITAAIVGIVGVCRQPPLGSSMHQHGGITLALVAAVANGLFFWLMARASSGGVAWAVFINRAAAVSALALIVLARGQSLRPAIDKQTVRVAPLAGVLGFAGIALYAAATVHGGLAIVSVLGSLYPVATVVLAQGLLGERLHGPQLVGVIAVLAGVLMMSV